MIRCRFKVPDDDYRPIRWPVKHPYWCTGTDSEGRSVIVAYADDEDEIMRNWPDAQELDTHERDTQYTFTSRFPRPEWLPKNGSENPKGE